MPVGGNVSLSFAVTVTAVVTPTVVTNTATISADGDSFDRYAWVLLVPEPLDSDSVPPVVHSLTIDEQDGRGSPDGLISPLTQSGLDPLGTAEAPDGPFVIYLPMVIK